jgi:GntR family transcriptional repressor for pyruvate dehydrogenase complex
MFEPVAGTRVADAAAAQLRNAVLSGDIAPGERLPAERQLAEQLGISRLTLRHAIGQLTAEGLLEVRAGEGCTVRDVAQHGSLDVLVQLFRAVQGQPRAAKVLADLLELRRTAAAEVAALAAERRKASHLRALDKLVDEIAQAPGRPRLEVSMLERKLAQVLVDAADNLAFSMLFHTVQRFLDTFPRLRDGVPTDLALLAESYRALVETVRAQDAEQARALVRMAFSAVDAQLVATFTRKGRRA